MVPPPPGVAGALDVVVDVVREEPIDAGVLELAQPVYGGGERLEPKMVWIDEEPPALAASGECDLPWA